MCSCLDFSFYDAVPLERPRIPKGSFGEVVGVEKIYSCISSRRRQQLWIEGGGSNQLGNVFNGFQWFPMFSISFQAFPMLSILFNA